MKRSRSAVVGRERGENEPPLWLDASREEFVANARKLGSARGKAARVQLLREGLGGKFAARLLGEALRDSELQVECWKLVGQLWTHEPWQRLLRSAGAEGAQPSPRSFSNGSLLPIVQVLLGLYGKDVLAWCVYAYLISSGQGAKEIEQAIVSPAFGGKAVIEAVGDALNELQTESKPHPRGISRKVANLLSQSLTGSRPSRDKSPKKGSLTLSPDQAAALIKALLSVPTGGAVTADNPLENALAETAWIEADQALARALQQTPALGEAIREQTKFDPRVLDQLGEIIQAVRASAAKRELEIEGDPGSEVVFDPIKHARADPRVKAGKRVRIIAPTVYQGRGSSRRVLRVADVEPA